MPRLKPPRNAGPVPERNDHEEPTEPIEIILDGPAPDEVEVDLAAPPPKADAEPAPVRKVEAPAEDDPLTKALEAQRRAEELQRNAQRERDDAVRRVRDNEQELVRERGDREEAQYNSVLTAIAAEQSAVSRAKSDFANAMSAQDFAAAADAQAAMASAAARLDRLEDGKLAFENKREASKVEKTERAETRPAQQDFEQRISGLPENARGWLRKHPEFINDTVMNRKIQAAHGAIIELDGVEPYSTAYFDALDSRFGFKAAAQQAEPAAPQRRSLPMSAPVSRQAPSPSGERQSNNMTLSPEERAVARNSFTATDMSNAQKEYLYAQNKQRYQKMKANGQYTEQKQ